MCNIKPIKNDADLDAALKRIDEIFPRNRERRKKMSLACWPY